MFTVFLDASGSADTDSLVVAGFVAPTEQWNKFEKEWGAVLDAYGVSALHMREYTAGTGEFNSWLPNKDKRARFMAALIAVLKRRVSFSFAHGLDTAAFQNFRKQTSGSELYRRFSSPFALAGATCIANVASWAIDAGINARDLSIVFEDGDTGKGNLMELSDSIFHMKPSFKKKPYRRAFQAADLLAYEVFRAQGEILKLVNGEKIGVDMLRKSFASLRSLPGSKAWGFKDQRTFRHYIEKAQRLTRP